MAKAIGIALVYMLIDALWICFEIHNVIILLGCPSTLHSTRVMRDLFGFRHDFECLNITVPGRRQIEIRDDSMSFKINSSFSSRTPRRSTTTVRTTTKQASACRHTCSWLEWPVPRGRAGGPGR